MREDAIMMYFREISLTLSAIALSFACSNTQLEISDTQDPNLPFRDGDRPHDHTDQSPLDDAEMSLDQSAPRASRDMEDLTDMGLLSLLDMTTADPCDGVDCGSYGRCVSQGVEATCTCEERYHPQGLTCVPEDVDGDGVDFTQDCNDQEASISPRAIERCDEMDQDCDGEVDEGACSIWVLEPRADRWTSYPLNVSGGGATPRGPIKAAWDIETEDLAFVLTERGYHEFRMSSLSWSPERPRADLFDGLDGPIRGAAFADSVPADHGASSGPRAERITISILNEQGMKRVWQLRYIIAEQRFTPNPNGLYNEVHVWDEALAPSAQQVQATWLDLENNRFILNVNTQELCGNGGQLSNIYVGLLSGHHIYMLEAGACFDFVSPIPLMGSPLDLPNAPRFDEVGAAFLHQGALYLFRGD